MYTWNSCGWDLAYLYQNHLGRCNQVPQKQTCRLLFSGGFCTGKTTLINMLMKEFPIEKLPDYTTRAMRPGEREGWPYFFLTPETFAQYDEQNRFLNRLRSMGTDMEL